MIRHSMTFMVRIRSIGRTLEFCDCGRGLRMAWSAVVTAGAWLLGRWSPAPTCSCHCSSDPSAGVLRLLERQLERCGPEQLRAPVPLPSPEAAAPCIGLGSVLFCTIVGFIAGVITCLVLSRQPHRSAESVEGLAALPAPSATSSSASSGLPLEGDALLRQKGGKIGGRGTFVTG